MSRELYDDMLLREIYDDEILADHLESCSEEEITPATVRDEILECIYRYHQKKIDELTLKIYTEFKESQALLDSFKNGDDPNEKNR